MRVIDEVGDLGRLEDVSILERRKEILYKPLAMALRLIVDTRFPLQTVEDDGVR
jgi:hypothetical protein